MFTSYEISYYLNFVILGLAVYYLYKAVRQIFSRDVDFFKKEIYTDRSISKWAVVDGILKVCAAAVFSIYGGFGLVGVNLIYPAIAVLVVIVILYFVLYSKILVRKEEY